MRGIGILEGCDMRCAVRRVDAWSAARVGALFGFMHGLLLGAALVGLRAVLEPLLQYFGPTTVQPWWPVVLLFGVFGGSAGAIALALGALLYNVVGWLGAPFVVEIEPREPQPGLQGSNAVRSDAARGELLRGAMFSDSMLVGE
jgi:hypothetical protein